MTAKIKLNAASGGGSFSLQAPSSSANTRVMTLPDTADGTILTTTNPKAGNIIQVVSTTKTDVFTTTSTSFTDITGLSVTITPQSTNSKILILFGIFGSNSNAGSRWAVRLLRDPTAIAIGDADGNRARVTGGSETTGGGGNMKCFSGNHLDSPSTTSATTYKFQAGAIDGNTLQINRSVADSNISSYPRTASYLTAMEVAA